MLAFSIRRTDTYVLDPMHMFDRIGWVTPNGLRNLAVDAVCQLFDRIQITIVGFGDQLLRNKPERFVILAGSRKFHAKRFFEWLWFATTVCVTCHFFAILNALSF